MSPDDWGDEWSKKTSESSFKQAVKNFVLRDFNSLFSSWIADVGSDAPKVLELGCAPGTMLRRIHSVCPRAVIHGLDYSPKGIQITEDNLRLWGIEAKISRGDIFLFEPDEKVDLVLSCGLIEHFIDPSEAIRAHAKFALPGGLVAATVPNLSHPFVKKCLERFRPRDLEVHNLEIMSEKSLRESFEKAGFVEIETGTATGPLLPAPGETGVGAKLYALGSMAWNTCSLGIPASMFWPGSFWAIGRTAC
jgi:2-polyprenyl-3-methyl-5-hydroxy-6-metoxy-1,4-benzoquinol methylase